MPLKDNWSNYEEWQIVGVTICHLVEQTARRSYYRGENQVFQESIPTLLRSLKRYPSGKKKELYRMVADMRIAEFSFFLNQFQHVRNWTCSDVLHETLSQHYGLETGWLDIANDFNVALIFAACFWEDGQWKPLSRKQTEVDEQHQYGMFFHMPSNQMPVRWSSAIQKFMPWTDKIVGKNEAGDNIHEHC